MAPQRNTRNIYSPLHGEPILPLKDISLKGLVAHPEGRALAISWHLDKIRTVCSRSPHRRHTVTAGQPCRARFDRRSLCPSLLHEKCTALLPCRSCRLSYFALRVSRNLVNLSPLEH
ncbi:hypothetical protein PoB_004354700 [Plakobranchus ocellatus]|uniref:Uncharacterized protein n=1 Tax=Plakobranchus ocellatus TaxID=259542 RepID=A0AAV4BDL1_9GAST|nr:hypothetical protein PoB_004354700 [Plakobranchus ocellatus]